jgi:hypothetical protein
VVAVFAIATFAAVVAFACLAGVVDFLGVTVVVVVSLSPDGVLTNLAVCEGTLVFRADCIFVPAFVPAFVADFFILFIFSPESVLVLKARTSTV